MTADDARKLFEKELPKFTITSVELSAVSGPIRIVFDGNVFIASSNVIPGKAYGERPSTALGSLYASILVRKKDIEAALETTNNVLRIIEESK